MLSLLLVGTVLVLTLIKYSVPAIKFIRRKRKAGEPPIVSGNFIFGSGADFQNNAVKFLHLCKDKFGPIFTIRLLNKWVTIVADTHAYQNFAKEKNFDFDPIQKQVNKNVFLFELKNSQMMIRNASKSAKGLFLAKNMVNFSRFLNDALKEAEELASEKILKTGVKNI